MECLGLVSVLRVQRLGLVSVLWTSLHNPQPLDCKYDILAISCAVNRHSAEFVTAWFGRQVEHVLPFLRKGIGTVSYTHLTLPTKRIV